MSWRALRWPLLMILFGVGLPLFIVYNIFWTSSVSERPIEGFDQYREELMQIERSDYRVHSVQNDGGVLRVNIVLDSVPQETDELRRRTMNALYDVQTMVGRELSSSVWVASPEGDNLKFEGMAFYHSLTENYVFKTAEELP